MSRQNQAGQSIRDNFSNSYRTKLKRPYVCISHRLSKHNTWAQRVMRCSDNQGWIIGRIRWGGNSIVGWDCWHETVEETALSSRWYFPDGFVLSTDWRLLKTGMRTSLLSKILAQEIGKNTMWLLVHKSIDILLKWLETSLLFFILNSQQNFDVRCPFLSAQQFDAIQVPGRKTDWVSRTSNESVVSRQMWSVVVPLVVCGGWWWPAAGEDLSKWMMLERGRLISYLSWSSTYHLLYSREFGSVSS